MDTVQAGFGMTNPDPLYHPRNLTMFDPSPSGPQPDDDILPKAAHTLGNMLAAAAGICHGICKVGLMSKLSALQFVPAVLWLLATSKVQRTL